jgi:hypothetical protein
MDNPSYLDTVEVIGSIPVAPIDSLLSLQSVSVSSLEWGFPIPTILEFLLDSN